MQGMLQSNDQSDEYFYIMMFVNIHCTKAAKQGCLLCCFYVMLPLRVHLFIAWASNSLTAINLRDNNPELEQRFGINSYYSALASDIKGILMSHIIAEVCALL